MFYEGLVLKIDFVRLDFKTREYLSHAKFN